MRHPASLRFLPFLAFHADHHEHLPGDSRDKLLTLEDSPESRTAFNCCARTSACGSGSLVSRYWAATANLLLLTACKKPMTQPYGVERPKGSTSGAAVTGETSAGFTGSTEAGGVV